MTDIYLLDINKVSAEAYESMRSHIPPERVRYAQRYVRDVDRKLSVAAAYLLYLGLKARGISLSDVSIKRAARGKPYICDAAIRFNISHSGDIAVCAISDGEVGVDIQKINSCQTSTIRAVCTDLEYDRINSLPDSTIVAEFTRIWTVKESFIKYTGEGLSMSLRRLETVTDRSVALYKDGIAQDVFFTEVDIPGYKLTLCTAKNESLSNIFKIDEKDIV